MLPTKSLANGQVAFVNATDLSNGSWQAKLCKTTINGLPAVLAFDFGDGKPNQGEGGVRVGTRFYTEGANSMVVGIDDANGMTAEHAALLALATKKKTRATFQRYATADGRNWFSDEFDVPVP